MAKVIIKTIGGEMLDAITHQYYPGNPKALAAVLDENPGLANMGPVLHADIDIILPELPEPEKEQIKLWD